MKAYVCSSMMLVFTFCLLNAQVPADDGWFELGNAGDHSELFSMAFTSASTGYAVGSGGTILRTIDAGKTWVVQDADLILDLKEIIFFGEQTGYMYGTYGYLNSKCFRTSDGGLHWEEVFGMEGGNEKINSMYFNSDSTGWLTAYNQYFKTTDGGDTWNKQTFEAFNDIHDIAYLNPDTGFMATNSSTNSLQRTVDGGATWQQSFHIIVGQLETTSDNYMYLVRGGGVGIYYTNDYGNSWIDAHVGITFQLEGIRFINDSTGFCWGIDENAGKLMYTSNYGRSWQLVYNNPFADINGVCLSPSGALFAYGKGGLIMESADGITWELRHQGRYLGGLNRIVFLDDSKGVAVGDHGDIFQTEDAGITWSRAESGTNESFQGLDFVNDTVGFVSGANNVILKTTDGGKTWTQSNEGYVSYRNFGIDMVDERTGYVASTSGVFKTIDGGDTWTSTGHTGLAYSLQCLDADTILAGGNTRIDFSYDGGSTWENWYTFPSFFSLHFFDSKSGFIGDSWGRVKKTVNGGENFDVMHDCKLRINDMVFINDTTAYFVADQGYIGKTTDGGLSWYQVASGTSRNLYSIFFTAGGHGYICGKDGMVLRRAYTPVYSLEFDVDDETGTFVEGVSMTVNEAIFPEGKLKATGLIEGLYDYSLSKPGYTTKAGLVYVQSDTLVHVVMTSTVATSDVMQNTMSIYPNPTTGRFVVDAAGQQLRYCRVVDMLGQLVFALEVPAGKSTIELDLSHVDSGLYFFIGDSAEDRTVLRFIKTAASETKH
jgi:photosystem II stability/assembly factor-like uncharacterized protein